MVATDVPKDGPSGSLKRFSFRGLEDREFRDPAAIERRYREAIQGGVCKDCEIDRIAFFRIMIHIGRSKNCKSRAGLLTQLLRGMQRYGKGWRERPNGDEDDLARDMIRRLDGRGERPEARGQGDEESPSTLNPQPYTDLDAKRIATIKQLEELATGDL